MSWSLLNNSATALWKGIATSSNGKIIAAVYNNNGGLISISKDEGITWSTPNSPREFWNSISMSSDGTYILATYFGSGTGYYVSKDSGVTWTEFSYDSSTHNFTSCAVSSNGQYQFACSSGSTVGIYISSDYGSIWSQSSAPNSTWSCIAVNSTGQNVIALASNGSSYYNNNYGVGSWQSITTLTNPNIIWSGVASNSSGQILYACGFGNYIYTSSNYGTTWTRVNLGNGLYWTNISVNQSGKYIIASNINNIYTSTDSGSSWSTNTSYGASRVVINSDGGIGYAIRDSNQKIYKYLLPFSFTISPTSATVVVGTFINSYYNITTTGSEVTSYSISPPVSEGLIFDTTTGILSGFSNSAIYTRTVYTITGYNSTGTPNVTFTLTFTPGMVCFKEDSKILTKQGYRSIQDLRKGDLIKTIKHGYVPIDMIGYREIENVICEERIKDKLYVCTNKEYSEIFEDLVITGCHSILVDNYTTQEQLDKSTEVNGGIYETDGKWRLPACVDERAKPFEKAGKFMIYHLALENKDYFMNYGIYANGLVVETCSRRYIKELSNMKLIE